MTLRRRGTGLIKNLSAIPAKKWQKITIDNNKRKYPVVRVYDELIHLRHFNGDIRRIRANNLEGLSIERISEYCCHEMTQIDVDE